MDTACRREVLLGFAVFSALLVSAGCARPEPSDVLVPPLENGGCWVRFYERPEFGSPTREIEGPTLVEATAGMMIEGPGIARAAPQPLLAEARSLQTGPSAQLTGYSGTMFRGETTVLGPATPVSDARAIGYPERFASFKIRCAG